MKIGKIWINGTISNQSSISLLSHCLHYGTGAFEGMRSYNGKIFKANEHYDRLRYSGSTIGIEIPYDNKALIKTTYGLLEENNLKNAYIRPLIYKTSDTLKIKAKCESNIMIACWALENYFDKAKLDKGISVTFSKYRKLSEMYGPVGTKLSGLYALNVLASQNIGDFDDAIMLDEHGFVAECTTSNIFMVKNNELITPIPDCFLNGITRQTVIELAKRNGIKVIEKKIRSDELFDAEGLFITGTAVEIMPITKVDNHIFCVPDLTKKLMNLFHLEVTKTECSQSVSEQICITDPTTSEMRLNF